jgi:hypothetical protein
MDELKKVLDFHLDKSCKHCCKTLEIDATEGQYEMYVKDES